MPPAGSNSLLAHDPSYFSPPQTGPVTNNAPKCLHCLSLRFTLQMSGVQRRVRDSPWRSLGRTLHSLSPPLGLHSVPRYSQAHLSHRLTPCRAVAHESNAESAGFEPAIPFWSIHAFQACAFDRSANSPLTFSDAILPNSGVHNVRTFKIFIATFISG